MEEIVNYEIIYIPALKYEDIRTKTMYDITFKTEDIFSFKTTYSVGDKIKTELTELFDGVSLMVKEQ